MVNKDGNIDFDLLTAYILDECSSDEKRVVEDWINLSPENLAEFELCKKTLSLDYNIDQADESGKQLFNVDKAWKSVNRQIELPLPMAEINRNANIKVLGKNKSFVWIGIAASFMLICSLLIYFYTNLNPEEIKYAFDEGTNEIILPDSSKAVLQHQSAIMYNAHYNKNNRIVSLKGKAYFDVLENDELPFEINTQHGKITVLGTAFTIEELDNALIVEVERGTVRLESKLSGEAVSSVLNANEKGQLSFVDNQIDKTQLSSVNHMYWANNKLTYRRAKLAYVFDELAGVFEKQINYDPDAIANCRLSAVFMNQNFDVILQGISISLSFEYEIENDTISIISSGCTSY